MQNNIRTLMILALTVTGYAASIPIESARVHNSAGALGCTVTGASVATPSVITRAAAHGLLSKDQVQITGVGGITVNTLAYAKVLSSTTFSIYADADFTIPIPGAGAYTSGGAATMAYDVSTVAGSWVLRLRVLKLTAGKNMLVSIQDSADGFVSDIRTLAVANLTGTTPPDCTGNACGPAIEYSWASYLLPSARVGAVNGRLRLYVQSLDPSGSAAISWFIEQ